MVIEGNRCSRCGAEDPGPRCGTCLESDHPSILLQRGAKWGPLGVAVFSLLCDPLMIPTVMAIWRATGELRQVAQREALGLHRWEHARVRSEAVWAIVIAAARPLVVAVVFLIAGVTAAVEMPLHPVLPADEVGEILERVRSDDEEVRGLALDHLDELGPELSIAQLDRVLDAVDAGFGHDEETEAGVRSAVVGAFAGSPLIVERSERIARLYPTLDRLGRGILLDGLLEVGSREALGQFGTLAGGDRDPMGVTLLTHLLEGRHADADLFVPPLVRLPADASLRAGVPRLIGALCSAGLDERALTPVRERLITDWHEVRAALPPPGPRLEGRVSREAVWVALQAQDQLDALRCVAGDDVDTLLVEASAHPDSLVAVAAVRALLARGNTVSRAIITRLAADPLSRADLFTALRRHGREREIPPPHRTERAIAEAQLLRELWSVPQDDLALSYRWVERVEPQPGAGVHVFALTLGEARAEDEPAHVAIGPYPEALTTDEPRLRWPSEGDALDPAALAAALLDELDAERRLTEELDALELRDLRETQP